ncbi:class I SAM-dependent methyltransferase [Kitasatospora kifunensis]|uniref:SAM-dependent methyltransferase n=1 Tax=Kitasatospora kifunensis TaxID=58351 RepID=A0A7W7RB30_KITKI|nr:class I SAM-dependent methyltransferase [Kitasatospora kifunensis]MBB4928418.1 SAM-dependent methyltransferase [Kitasatospora kifunensis]
MHEQSKKREAAMRLQLRGTFDADAGAYHRGRPGYPARVYEILSERCGLGPGCHVLEVGPGTGQATGELLARGARIHAVELGGQIARQLRRAFLGKPLSIVEGDFDLVPIQPATYDLAVAATSLHWLDPCTAVPKIADALKPEGWLAAWWTAFGDPERPTAFRAHVERIHARHLPEKDRGIGHLPYALRIQDRVADLRAADRFGPVEVTTLRWEAVFNPAQIRQLFATFSYLLDLPAHRREMVLDKIAQAAESLGEAIVEPYVTTLFLTRRTI